MTKKQFNIMLVDDEDIILEVGERLIKHLGHRCIKANDEIKAVELFKEHCLKNIKIDMVIIDLTLGNEYSGSSLIKELSDIDKNVTGIISSGYLNDPVMIDFLKFGFKGAIRKPYGLKDIENLIDRILN